MECYYFIIGVIVLVLILGFVSGGVVVYTDFSADAKKEAIVFYYLPESIFKIKASAKVAVVYNGESKLIESYRIFEESFEVTTEMTADTQDLLSLNYNPNALMADEIKYAVNAKGLLETVNVTTEDRTAPIVSGLAAAPVAILSKPKSLLETADRIVKITEYTSDFEVRASLISDTPNIFTWSLHVYNELGVNEELRSVQADFGVSSPQLTTARPKLGSLIYGKRSKKTEIAGILTRPIKNISLKIQPATKEKGLNATLLASVMVADVTKVIVVPVRRSAYVKRINKIGVQDGIVLSNEINKPSSVEGFLSIPINIAKAIVSIPAQLIQFRFDNTKKLDELEKEKLKYEKSIQESKEFALTKEWETEKIKLDLQKSELTNKMELQRLEFDLKTSLLEAEKKLRKAEKDLIETKKELESLKQK